MKKFIIISILIISLTISTILIYGITISPKKIKTNEIKILSSSITDNFNGFKIVHLSDIYYGNTVDDNMLNKVVDEINLINPDIIVITGDTLTNENYSDNDILAIQSNLNNMHAKLGKYIIKGDNDLDIFEDIIKDTDFTFLNDSYTYIYNTDNMPILLVGINSNDDINEKLYNVIKDIPLTTETCYKILITHKPDSIMKAEYDKFNLILAGHSLGGINIFGKRFNLPDGAKKYYKGEYNINNTILYVSTGLGTNNTKYRFSNNPSINFYRIVK